MVRLPARNLADHALHTQAIPRRYLEHAAIPYPERHNVGSINSGASSKLRQVAGLFAYCLQQGPGCKGLLERIVGRPFNPHYRSIRIYSLIFLYQVKGCMREAAQQVPFPESRDFKVLQRYVT